MTERNIAFALFNNPELLKKWRDDYVGKFCECKQLEDKIHRQDCKAFQEFLAVLQALGRGYLQPPSENQEIQIVPFN